MSDQFTPLTFGTLPLRESSSSSAAAVSAFRPLPAGVGDSASHGDVCARPTVTLLRNASGVVTSIRLLCGCGRVTELNCVY